MSHDPRPRDMHEPVRAKHIEVVPRPGESADRLLRRFTKKVRAEGLMDELRNRRHFEKPSVKRRRKSANAAYNRKRELAEKI